MKIDEIKIKRQALGLSQEELARKINVSFTTINRWEGGKTKPNKKNHQLLKKILLVKGNLLTRYKNEVFRPIQYLGSKKRLVSNISNLIQKVTHNNNATICDIFSGSGVVTQFLSKNYNTISVDIQKYSSVLTSSLINNKTTPDDLDKFISEIQDEPKYNDEKTLFMPLIKYETDCLNKAKSGDSEPLVQYIEEISLYTYFNNILTIQNKKLLQIIKSLEKAFSKKEHLITLYFGGVYFSIQQAMDMDYIYTKIINTNCSEKEKIFYKAILLSVASHIANTVGKQFAQPIKLLNKNGEPKPLLISRTIRDRKYNVLELFKEWGLKFINNQSLTNFEHSFFTQDFNVFLNTYKGKIDCFYADPPYTIDHYSRFYHVLETIVNYDFPKLMEKTIEGEQTLMRGLYREDRHQSPFSIKTKVTTAFDNLFKNAIKFKAPLILSYSPSNTDQKGRPRLLEIEELIAIAKKYYPYVEIEDIENHAHRKLNSKSTNNILFKNGEIFIICTLEKI